MGYNEKKYPLTKGSFVCCCTKQALVSVYLLYLGGGKWVRRTFVVDKERGARE